jgi:hypothetical protein
MLNLSKWIIVALISVYMLMSALGAMTITAIRAAGSAPATAPAEQAAYFMALPWGVIALMWIALLAYAASLTLIALGRPWATRLLSAAVAIDIGRWLWARATTAYSDVVSPAEQTFEALLFLVLIAVIVLMILERRRDAIT